jgi:hypothetical protein
MKTTDSDYFSLMKISKEDGVRDLPMAQRGPFAQAIRAERLARHEDSATAVKQLLEKADQAFTRALAAA